MSDSDSTPLSRRHLFSTAATSGLVATLISGAGGPRPDQVAAQPQDVADIDALLAALYGVISGPLIAPRRTIERAQ
jgi:hypothetical protein